MSWHVLFFSSSSSHEAVFFIMTIWLLTWPTWWKWKFYLWAANTCENFVSPKHDYFFLGSKSNCVFCFDDNTLRHHPMGLKKKKKASTSPSRVWWRLHAELFSSNDLTTREAPGLEAHSLQTCKSTTLVLCVYTVYVLIFWTLHMHIWQSLHFKSLFAKSKMFKWDCKQELELILINR